MSESWWTLKQTLIVQYDIARIQNHKNNMRLLMRHLTKMDSVDGSQSFLNYITSPQFK